MGLRKATLSQRIFLSMIGLISLSLITVAAINIQQIKEDTTNYNKERLARKDRSVAKSIESLVDYNQSLKNAFEQILKEVSYIHKLKLNIYDLNGNFILSSDSTLSLDTTIIKPISRSTITQCFESNKKKIEYEKGVYFGTYRVLYKPTETYTLTSSEPIITNIPYCVLNVIYDKSTQNDIRNEIKRKAKTLIKVYVLLLLFAIIFAYFLLQQITAPLRSIAGLLSSGEVNSTPKPLIWPVKDEIGQLVESYNELISELNDRTKQLIKSEKEGAWKKMAKQIAHEIKNPLTPMRLSVQYLQKSFNDGEGAGLYSDEWKEKLDEFSITMIQQIDTLNRIANAFSDFASLNNQSLESISILDEVKRVVHVFKNNNVKLVNRLKLKQTEPVHVDKSHLTRVLNNLIQNSLQAERDDEPISVIVEINKQHKCYNISIKDNGKGIPQEIQDKIFEPNFTTKNSGTGLGLSMVKKIIDDLGGRITYSTNNKGTVFEFTIPINKH